MSYTSTQIAELFLETEKANRFDAVEYRLLINSDSVSLSNTLRSSAQYTPTASVGIKSFQDKLLTTYGL